jgi:hypothetical protein
MGERRSVVGVVVVFSSREERDVEFVAKVIDREKVKEARTMSSFCPFFFYFWPLFFILFLNRKNFGSSPGECPGMLGSEHAPGRWWRRRSEVTVE